MAGSPHGQPGVCAQVRVAIAWISRQFALGLISKQSKQASQGNQVANLLQAGWMDCGNPPNQPTKRKTMPPFFILPLMIFLSSFSTCFRDGIHSCVCAYPCMCIWSFPSWSLLYLFISSSLSVLLSSPLYKYLRKSLSNFLRINVAMFRFSFLFF